MRAVPQEDADVWMERLLEDDRRETVSPRLVVFRNECLMSEPFTEKIAAYFRARPNQWLNALELEKVGGRFAWRTRVSNARTQLGMDIQNRQRRIVKDDGTRYTISEYRYVPKPEEFQLTA